MTTPVLRATAIAAASLIAINAFAQVAPSSAQDALPTGTFNTPTSGSNLSQTPSLPGSYDLAGIGRRDTAQEVILTEPVSGVPIRFDNGIFVFPSVLVGVGHNDNITGVNTGAISSNMFSLQPRVVAELKKSGDRYTLTYNANHTRYGSSSADNFNSYDLTLAGDNYFSARSRLGWSAGYVSSADPRGSTDRVQSEVPDRWHAPVIRGLYVYGAKGAKGRFEIETNLQAKRYDNNRSFTVGSDVDINALSGRFYARFMPKTSAVFELRRIASDYKLSTSSNDNDDTQVLVGLSWDAAAKTTGSFKVGHQRKNYKSAAVRDASNATWEGSIQWEPLSYSVFDLTTGRTASDSTGLGNFVTNTGTNLTWTHRWKSHVATRATLSSVRSDYDGAGRIDNTRSMGLGVFYDFRSNLRFGLEVANTRRTSNQSLFDFRRNTTFLSVEGTL